MKHYLSIVVGGIENYSVLLNDLPSFSRGSLTIGRMDDNDIILPYPAVSRHHAVLMIQGDTMELVDSGSLNQLRVGGSVYDRVRLMDGMTVVIGADETSRGAVSLRYSTAQDEPGTGSRNKVDAILAAKRSQMNVPGQQQPIVATPPPTMTPTSPPMSTPEPMPEPQVQIPQSAQPAPDKQSAQGKNPSAKSAKEKNFFGRRLCAMMIDFLVWFFILVGAIVILFVTVKQFNLVLIFGVLAAVLIGWLYFAVTESSEQGGTLGKMIMGIGVVSTAGYRLTMRQASVRFFAKLLSILILFIGFLPIFGKKQTLHDYISNCKVIRTRE